MWCHHIFALVVRNINETRRRRNLRLSWLAFNRIAAVQLKFIHHRPNFMSFAPNWNANDLVKNPIDLLLCEQILAIAVFLSIGAPFSSKIGAPEAIVGLILRQQTQKRH